MASKSVVLTFSKATDCDRFLEGVRTGRIDGYKIRALGGSVTVSTVIESHVIPADPSGLEAGKGQRTGKKA